MKYFNSFHINFILNFKIKYYLIKTKIYFKIWKKYPHLFFALKTFADLQLIQKYSVK